MNPLEASNEIERAYQSYLRTTFAPRRPDWKVAFEQALNTDRLSQGPYLQATPPFRAGASVRQLMNEGVLSRGFSRLAADVFPLDRALYVHQEQAIRHALAGRNLLIATGTGSGKTECILFPTIEELLREAAAGTLAQPGVRALLLYPMNALANDQLRRLRELLRPFPEISFGRYVGDTKERRTDARSAYQVIFPGQELLPNEKLSREEMREEPPHILLTNFSMLEYLLLRPEDTPFFDGDTGKHWRVIALDEAHVYDGANGAEIAMLLRRLRDRVVRSEKGRLRYVATSATLGKGRGDYPALAAFGQALFDERFEWDPGRAEDIVGPVRRERSTVTASYELPADTYARLREARADGVAGLRSVLEADCPPAAERIRASTDVPAALHAVLCVDERVIRLQTALEGEAKPLADAAVAAFGDSEAHQQLVALVELAAAAREDEKEAPLIPARYHFWLRGLEGAFVCLHPSHPADAPSLLLRAADSCPACAARGIESVLFELGACRRCRAEYAVGVGSSQESLHRTPIGVLPRVYLLLDDAAPAPDEDEEDEDDRTWEDAAPLWLCPACGKSTQEADEECDCEDKVPRRRVVQWTRSEEDPPLKRCLACSQTTNGGEVVGRFLTDANAPASVIATALYQQLPPATDPVAAAKLGGGRKLLAFADSRQEAAFFAPYFERTYESALWRSLIIRGIEALYVDSPLQPTDLLGWISQTANRELVLDPSATAAGRRQTVYTWILRELLALDRRQSLEGVGLVRIRPRLPDAPAPAALGRFGLEPEVARTLTGMLIDTLRTSGVLTFPPEVSRDDEAFAPRHADAVVRGIGPEPKRAIYAWTPKTGSNRRHDLLEKVAAKQGLVMDGAEINRILTEVWTELTAPSSAWASLLPKDQDPRRGGYSRLAHELMEFTPAKAAPRWRCNRCMLIWWSNVLDVCPTFRCAGKLELIGDEAPSHYADLYLRLKPLVMRVQEHTAQWRLEQGSKIQNAFLTGDLNVLSCSTTFELGVDVGEVEAVLMRNVPPSPANYVQRAGRAGRRAGAAAMVLTLAQRRNHDLSWFRNPVPMITGEIRPPQIVTDNPVIARRHAHSVAFAAWLRQEPTNKVGDFVLADGVPASGDERFLDWLRTHPTDVGQALQRILPSSVAEEVDLEEWSWVEALAAPSEDDPAAGWLDRAAVEVRDDVALMQREMDEASAKHDFRLADRIKRQMRAITDENLIGFLARRNVLPKYGFPVDVVELDVSRTGLEVASNIQLDRDLRLAIAEYAPGSEVVAAKMVWTSAGLKRHPTRGWRTRTWAVCGSCTHYYDGLPEAMPDACPACRSTERKMGGTWIAPIFGFIGRRSDSTIGEGPTLRRASTQSWFGEYRTDVPEEPNTPAGIAPGTAVATASRQGRIIVVNQGPTRRGYRICDACGFAEAAPAPSRKASKEHRDPVTNRPCKAPLGAPRQLGHDFLTDVVELRLAGRANEAQLRSALYALLEGASRLGIKRSEIDGTLHWWSPLEDPALVIYDTVPGGAGHAKAIGENLAEVVAQALERVRDCECGPETSCYGCLRSYTNQIWHDILVRSAAEAVLAPLRP